MFRFWITTLMIFVVVGLGVTLWARMAKEPAGFGTPAGVLAPCPDRPNCVSSASVDPRHHVEPIPFTTTPEEAQTRLRIIVQAMGGSRIVAEEPGYLAVTFRVPVLGFLDDAEFRIDADSRRIEVRSASRIGWHDLGVNRRRIEDIRRAFHESEPTPSTTDTPL